MHTTKIVHCQKKGPGQVRFVSQAINNAYVPLKVLSYGSTMCLKGTLHSLSQDKDMYYIL